MDLDSMKYAELRGLAKELGLKANMKADKLLKAIKEHYQQEKNKEEEQGPDSNDGREDENEDSPSQEEAFGSTGFVNTRRGKVKGTKRKISDTATLAESDAKMPPNAAEGVTEMDASSAPCSARGAKKRKVSSAKDADKTEKEPPKESQTTDGEEQQLQPGIKDEASVDFETAKAPKVARAGKIPRLQQKSKPTLKPVTPNFKKLHEAHFNKMESIDSYVQRKTKQMETYRNSVKELKMLSDKTKPQQVDGKAQARAIPSRATMFSPAPANKGPAEEKRRHTLLSATKKPPPAKEEVPFRPSVLSTRRINVRFSEATHDNEYKKSLVKTPARMSPCVTSSTPQTQTASGVKPSSIKTSSFSATKTPGPFVFIGNTSTTTTPGTQKKPAFDLKASLSRPLTYKPHKGKLKPFGEAKENPSGNKSLVSNAHQETYKQHKIQSREDRRTKQIQDRKQKKENMLGARRGLVMM